MSRTLTGKTIVITGGSAGIGAATALRAADAGMDVALGARRAEKLAEVAEEVRQRGRKAVAVTCDVTVDADVQRLFDTAWEQLGRVDAVFANAGYGLHGSVLELDEQAHRDLFETNYWGTVRTLKAAYPRLRQTASGLKHVLICSSAASEIGIPMMGAYCATKAAQDALAGALRGELADAGYAVTSVHPVGTKTEFFDVVNRRSPRERESSNTPAFMMQTPDDVAKAVVKALRRPTPEVWPLPVARLGLALTTLLPSVTHRWARTHARRNA